jgi:hypothetical protein
MAAGVGVGVRADARCARVQVAHRHRRQPADHHDHVPWPHKQPTLLARLHAPGAAAVLAAAAAAAVELRRDARERATHRQSGTTCGSDS